MPEIKANEPLPERPAIIVIFGDAGIGKTSLADTCADPYTIDFDKGLSRASSRGDALLPDNWEEVLEHEKKGTFKKYTTLCIDTAKACLDDFLMSYVVKLDYKNQKNKQAAYGAIGDQFKLFVSNRRQDKADLLIIAHAKDKEDGDVTKKIPDVTGQSYQLLLRIADQIGYYTTRNNRRVIQWDPTDFSVGKNVARLPVIEVPEDTDPRYRTFMADIFALVKASIVKESEAQRSATLQSQAFQLRIQDCATPDCLTDIIKAVNELPDHLKLPLRTLVNAKAKAAGYIANVQTRRFELPAQTDLAATGAPIAKEAEKPSVPAKEPELPVTFNTPYDDRCRSMAELGMQMNLDQAEGFGLVFTYEQIGDMTEELYMEAIGKIGDAKKASMSRPRRQRPAGLAQPH